MWWPLANNLLVLLCCTYAWFAGGRPEKIGALAILLGSILTFLAMRILSGAAAVNFGVLMIDVILLACFVGIALRTNRYWALWASGFHLVAVTTHAAMSVDAGAAPIAYAHSMGLWGYLVFIALAVGTRFEVRLVESKHGSENG